MQTDILIIGAGASGLAAAYELSLVDKKVIVLEARNRIGGRIHSVSNPRFAQIIETGAEFIHGKLPVTLQLLKKAGITHHAIKGEMWQIENGEIKKGGEFIAGWKKLMTHLRELKTDIPIKDFLNQHFPGAEEKELKDSVIKLVEGYDAADAGRASSLALLDEWEHEDDHDERIDNGYLQLMHFLEGKIKEKGNDIFLSQVVKNISWQKDRVVVNTTNEEQFVASKVLVTIPLGMWQSEEKEGHISFSPGLHKKNLAAKQMGFGTVIKIVFQFQNEFWEEEIPNKFKDASFIFSDAFMPTWWSQHPKKNGMLTGWLAGPKATELKDAAEDDLLKKGLQSLSYIFAADKAFIEKKLVAHSIVNWAVEPFTYGAYSYNTLDTKWAKKVLNEPIEETLYFAGEALYNGPETGTVEGALASGIEVARNIIALS